jgi:hypothetical protein
MRKKFFYYIIPRIYPKKNRASHKINARFLNHSTSFIAPYLAAGTVVPGAGTGAGSGAGAGAGSGAGAGAVVPVTASPSGFCSSAFLQPITANDTVAKKSRERIKANNLFINASPPFKNFKHWDR